MPLPRTNTKETVEVHWMLLAASSDIKSAQLRDSGTENLQLAWLHSCGTVGRDSLDCDLSE